MNRKFWITLLVIIILIVSYKVYSRNSDKNLMDKTNEQLKSLLEPYINNTVVVIDEEKYFLRIKEVKLSDYVETYKSTLDYFAHISFDVYKGKENKDNFIDNISIEMEVWRKDLESDFFTRGGQSQRSYKSIIFHEICYTVFNSIYENMISDLPTEELMSNYDTLRSNGNSDEDNIKYNEYGEITLKGDVRYEETFYAKGLSMKFTTTFYLEDFKEYHEMHINAERLDGDYHALWDLKKEDIDKVTFHYKGNYEGKKIITNKYTIEELIKYLKSIPFEQSEEQVTRYEYLIHIQLGDYNKDVTLSNDAIYTNLDHAVCKGENYVKKVIEILEKDN